MQMTIIDAAKVLNIIIRFLYLFYHPRTFSKFLYFDELRVVFLGGPCLILSTNKLIFPPIYIDCYFFSTAAAIL